jgi:hypothetical protein
VLNRAPAVVAPWKLSLSRVGAERVKTESEGGLLVMWYVYCCMDVNHLSI